MQRFAELAPFPPWSIYPSSSTSSLSLDYTYTSPSMTASLCLTALAFFDMPAAFLRCFLAAGAPVASVDMGVAAPEGSADASSNWPSPVVRNLISIVPGEINLEHVSKTHLRGTCRPWRLPFSCPRESCASSCCYLRLLLRGPRGPLAQRARLRAAR